MYSIRRLFAVTSAVLAFAAFAATAAQAASGWTPLRVTKTCSGVHCDITASNFAPLVGGAIDYAPLQFQAGVFFNASAVMTAAPSGPGSVSGMCTINFVQGDTGMCVFSLAPSGTLAGFKAVVKVTHEGQRDGNIWHWEGVYCTSDC